MVHNSGPSSQRMAQRQAWRSISTTSSQMRRLQRPTSSFWKLHSAGNGRRSCRMEGTPDSDCRIGRGLSVRTFQFRLQHLGLTLYILYLHKCRPLMTGQTIAALLCLCLKINAGILTQDCEGDAQYCATTAHSWHFQRSRTLACKPLQDARTRCLPDLLNPP